MIRIFGSKLTQKRYRHGDYRTARAATGKAPLQGGMVKNFLGSSRLDYQLFFRVARYDNNVKHVSIILDEPALLG